VAASKIENISENNQHGARAAKSSIGENGEIAAAYRGSAHRAAARRAALCAAPNARFSQA